MTAASPPRPPSTLFLMGPTAAGKTALAAELAQRFPFDIISVDSAMVYRGMDIGTGKPGPEVLARAPHRLIDIRDPRESYSAAGFRADARREIDDIRARGRIPLLVGGTGLYFRSLRDGFSRLPGADAAVRARLDELARRHGWEHLHRRLARLDPPAAARIHRNDAQRIQRALEVYELTGKTLSEALAAPPMEALAAEVVTIVLAPSERARLHAAIERRFRDMLARGFVAEVRRLRTREGMHPALPSMRAVGYRQIWAFLDGATGHEAMVDRGIAATRQLARRQLTWLRSEPGAVWLDGNDPARLDRVVALCRARGLTLAG